ncbi:unnamed protein product [Cercospora beticola]|nr:unnamed protein product [Cercospora beticola]
MANPGQPAMQREFEERLQKASKAFDKQEKAARQQWFSAVKNQGEKKEFQVWAAQNYPAYQASLQQRDGAQAALDQLQLQIIGSEYNKTKKEREDAAFLAKNKRNGEDQEKLNDTSNITDEDTGDA